MALYINQTGKLKEVKEKPFKLEKEIQKVFEANLPAIMGLELATSEFTIKNKRIDTLAYDPQNSHHTGVSTFASRTSPSAGQSLQKSFHLSHADKIEFKKNL